jgi:hypothetical protein
MRRGLVLSDMVVCSQRRGTYCEVRVKRVYLTKVKKKCIKNGPAVGQ